MANNEIDDDLARLEQDIRKLKIEYEQFFGGGKARPPADVEWRIDLLIKRYGDRAGDMNYTQRFRFGNLAQAYARYREVFHKRMRKREEGTVDRHYGAAARAIEAERARANARRPAKPVAVACGDPAHEPEKVQQIYEAFRAALESSGESSERLTPKAFERFLKQKAEQMRGKESGKEVEFVVSVEEGKARLKARVRS